MHSVAEIAAGVPTNAHARFAALQEVLLLREAAADDAAVEVGAVEDLVGVVQRVVRLRWVGHLPVVLLQLRSAHVVRLVLRQRAPLALTTPARTSASAETGLLGVAHTPGTHEDDAQKPCVSRARNQQRNERAGE